MFYSTQNRIPRNSNKVIGDISGYHGQTKEGICGEKNNDLETNSNNKNDEDLHRPASKFSEGYEARTNLVKGEKGNLFGVMLRFWNVWRNYFSHLLDNGC
jgi:hypothetical protein